MAHIEGEDLVMSTVGAMTFRMVDAEGNLAAEEIMFVENVEDLRDVSNGDMMTFYGATPSGLSLRITVEYGTLERRDAK